MSARLSATCGVERLGIALELEADYERRPDRGGGCEDPRITFVQPLLKYLMTYTALSTSGPRMTRESDGSHRLGRFTSHHRLAAPLSLWEQLKIGAGAPPVLIRHGWLIIYHGVSETVSPTNDRPALCYSVGVMVLSSEHPRVIRYRSEEPLLKPELPQ